jgi:hypothetical protein
MKSLHKIINRLALILLLIILISLSIRAQQEIYKHFYSELHLGIKYNFGPSEDQAEIVGGFDSLSYDNMQHYSPGFKSSVPVDLVIGYNFDNSFHLESNFSYYKLDMALIQTLNQSEYPFLVTNMFSMKVSGLFRFSDEDIDSSFGISTGMSVGAVFPFSDNINEETKNYFGIKNFQTNVEVFFEINASCYLPLNNDGLYLTAGTSFTLPWLIGSIGEIKLQSGSSYNVIRNEVQLYSISGFIGLGYRL